MSEMMINQTIENTENIDQKALELAQDFSYDGYQVVRRELFAHLRARKPQARTKPRAPNVQQPKSIDAPFGAFSEYAARRVFTPRPHTGGPAGQCLA